MDFMGYDAMNLGVQDFFMGTDYLSSISSDISFSFISTNLVCEKELSYVRKYIIKSVNGIRVGILGILPENAFDNFGYPEYVKGLTIMQPEKALNKILPVVRKKADIIVLLSYCGGEYTTSMLDKFADIDLAVSCGTNISDQNINSKVVQADLHGESLGVVKISRNDNGIKIASKEHIDLDDSVPDDDKIKKIISESTYKVLVEQKDEKLEEERKKMHRNLMDGLKLSPDEFFK